MKNSKLISLLETFSEDEMNKFVDFAAASYHNTNEALTRFASYLKKQHPEFPAEKVEKQPVFQMVFPNEPVDKKKLSYHMN